MDRKCLREEAFWENYLEWGRCRTAPETQLRLGEVWDTGLRPAPGSGMSRAAAAQCPGSGDPHGWRAFPWGGSAVAGATWGQEGLTAWERRSDPQVCKEDVTVK